MRLSFIAFCFSTLLFSCQSNPSNSVYTLTKGNRDFHILDHLFEGKQVIFLGEPSHGDGTIFEERVKLIQYLVEQHGFRNIVFESNFYDAEKINQLKANGALNQGDFSKATFDIWGQVTELDELWDFIASTPGVYFRGMDFQPHLLMREHFVSDLESAVEITEAERKLLSQIMETVSGTSISKRAYTASPEELETLKSIKRRIERHPDLDHLKMGMQAILNYLAIYSPEFPDKKAWARYNFKDSLMFAQLDYPKKNHGKVVVWLASAHSLERPELIVPTSEMDSMRISYKGYTPVGKRAREAYGKTMLNIAYSGLEGSFRDFVENKPYPFDLASENTIERSIIKQTGQPTYLNLHQLDSMFKSGVLGYEPMEADWSKNFDGLMILPLVEQSTVK